MLSVGGHEQRDAERVSQAVSQKESDGYVEATRSRECACEVRLESHGHSM
jgi:hypothetical protein